MDPARITQVGRRSDQELIDDPEHRDVGADPESERHDDRCGEHWASAKSTRGVAKVLEQDLEP